MQTGKWSPCEWRKLIGRVGKESDDMSVNVCDHFLFQPVLWVGCTGKEAVKWVFVCGDDYGTNA